MAYHKNIKVTEEKPEWNPSIPFELKLDFELLGGDLDISLVNGLRRTIYEDVPCLSIGPNIDMDVDKNITVFNTQYLKNRLSLQSIHLESHVDLTDEKYKKLVLSICDPSDPDKPLVNLDNRDKHITLNDLVVLEDTGTDSEDVVEVKEMESPGSVLSLGKQVGEAKLAVEEGEVDPDLDIDDKIKENQLEGAIAQTASAEALEDVAISAEDSGSISTAQEQPVPMKQVRKWKISSIKPADLFTYTGMYILTIKKGESIWTQMRLKSGTGKQHARWQSGIVIYGFKPRKSIAVDTWMDSDFDPIKNRQDYPRAKGISGQYGTPETFQLSIEYNGHYRPSMVWLSAIRELSKKITTFQELVRKTSITISEPGGIGDVNTKLKIEENPAIPNLLTMTILGEDHTLGNIVFSHYLYLLQRLVNHLYPDDEEFKNEILKVFSHYRIPHPLDDKLIIMLRALTIPNEELSLSLKSILPEGTNLYDDEDWNPSIRLLMIALDHVKDLLQKLEVEAEDIYEQSKNGTLERKLVPKRLPQAELKIQPKVQKEIEINSEVVLEEEEIVGEQEEAYQEAMDIKDMYNLDDVDDDDGGDDGLDSGGED